MYCSMSMRSKSTRKRRFGLRMSHTRGQNIRKYRLRALKGGNTLACQLNREDGVVCDIPVKLKAKEAFKTSVVWYVPINQELPLALKEGDEGSGVCHTDWSA